MKKFNSRMELLAMIRRYAAGLASEEEKRFLEAYYEHFENGDDILNHLTAAEKLKFESDLRAVLITHTDEPETSVKPLWSFSKIAAAAAAVLIVSSGLYFYLNQPASPEAVMVKKAVKVDHDIAPGGNIAILTLADGKRINLDKAANGLIAEQGGITISKQADGQLIYAISTEKTHTLPLRSRYNTIETPRGGEYQVMLPDGSHVWLNAASSLRFPVKFETSKRHVQLDGEAYFEVAASKATPFVVESRRQRVEVLGTHFNVNSYADETTARTTLLEGRVKVSIPRSNTSHLLKPGQQSAIKPSGGSINVKEVDVEESVAWKNGYFTFANEGIESIMRKIARWYNVEVEFKGPITAEGFGGSVSKSKNISEVLRILELTEAVHFKVEGRRVTVMP